MLVKEKITELSVNMRSAAAAAGVAAPQHYPVPYTGTPTPPVIPGAAVVPPPQVPPIGVRPPSAPAVAGPGAAPGAGAGGGPLSLDSLFGQGALAALLAGANRKSATPTPSQTGTPQPPVVTPMIPPPVPVAGTPVPPAVVPGAPAAAPAVASSLAALASNPILAGILQRSQTPTTTAPGAATAAVPPLSLGVDAPKPAASAPPTVPAAAGAAPPAAGAASASALPTNNPSALLAMLRQSGILSGGAAPIPVAPAAAPAAPPVVATPLAAPWTYTLTQYRGPSLINRLHEDLGPPCTQCGRRFGTDEEGRRKKTAHMDWHFRVHQRVTDAERRGQHRSWWVEQSDWVNSLEAIDIDHSHRSDVSPANKRVGVPGQDTLNYDDEEEGDDDDDDYDPEVNFGRSYANHRNQSGGGGGGANHSGGAAGGGGKATVGGRKGGKKGGDWLPVPEDSGTGKVNNMCPICQEKFEMKWLDEAQEWVWMDAMKVGGRVYHASCHREVNGTTGGAGGNGGGGGGGSNGMMMSGGGGGENGWGGGNKKRKAEVSSFFLFFLMHPAPRLSELK